MGNGSVGEEPPGAAGGRSSAGIPGAVLEAATGRKPAEFSNGRLASY
jgi:hypothetical protein